MTAAYASAPAARLLATHCALCGRPLLDAPSVECGMGPRCRERAMVGAPDAHRAEVNAIVARIAADTRAATVPADVATIASLGYATLARTLAERLAEGRAVTVDATPEGYAVKAPFDPAFNAALRTHCPGRRWDGEGKVWRVPAAAKRGLWTALREVFAGHPLVTASGMTMIG